MIMCFLLGKVTYVSQEKAYVATIFFKIQSQRRLGEESVSRSLNVPCMASDRLVVSEKTITVHDCNYHDLNYA